VKSLTPIVLGRESVQFLPEITPNEPLVPIFGTMDKIELRYHSLKVALASKSQFPKIFSEIA